jgi:hypothetical protein
MTSLKGGILGDAPDGQHEVDDVAPGPLLIRLGALFEGGLALQSRGWEGHLTINTDIPEA